MLRTPLSKKRSSKTSHPKYDLNHFAVITVIFNPIRYRSRYELYHKFDEHMTRSGVTLLTVECIFDDEERLTLAQQKFEITRPNDPRHLQIRAPSLFWLKENLINIAVKRLPLYVEYVAWLDADIEFETLDWPQLTIHELQRCSVVQLFQLSFFLGPSGKKQILRRDYSFVYAMQHHQKIDPRRSTDCYNHPGYAWAMRRNAFDSLGGLAEFAILGSGDIHFAYGLYNRIDETMPPGIHPDYRHLVRTWGTRLAQIAENGTKVGYVPVNILHYWHGHRRDRRYMERWALLESAQFSPLIDLEKNDQTGLLRFIDHYCLGQRVSAKRIENLEKSIVEYFRSRDEDNTKKPVSTIDTTVLTSQPITTVSLSSPPIPPLQAKPSDENSISIVLDDSINSSFWNYPSGYEAQHNETVY